MSINKNDIEARKHWGDRYDAIPKSVFAVIAWHLSDCSSDEGAGNGGAENRFMWEWDVLIRNGFQISKPSKKARRQE
jgi:hypothetical protein